MTANAELISLRGEVETLRRRAARLQAHVDEEGSRLAASIGEAVYDADSARDAINTYDTAWFDSLVYSASVTQGIAEALVRALAAYPFLDTGDIARRLAAPAQ